MVTYNSLSVASIVIAIKLSHDMKFAMTTEYQA